MSIILKAENISKQYRLGLVGTGTISHDLNRWWASIRGKEDPYLRVGAVNDRSTKAESDYVWALQDINFEVQKGEVLGIIGKNGAGKSTLLKILSRVTIPTTGEIKTKGRIASLLEVGTGFHPELTGRENIYLNGAILGMTKAEIKAKEEEIIDFSGCERYVDTPVKRYSSGMRVRLAFAVAAFLEPDILVIDEVLAVGDAEFQKKAIGKMQDISRGEGRTVLFVSHNMDSIRKLCKTGVILTNGRISEKREIESIVDEYLSQNTSNSSVPLKERKDREGNGKATLTKIEILNSNTGNEIHEIVTGMNIDIKVYFQLNDKALLNNNFEIGLAVTTKNDQFITVFNNKMSNYKLIFNKTEDFAICSIDNFPFTEGEFNIRALIKNNYVIFDLVEDAVKINVHPGDFYKSGKINSHGRQGIYLKQRWSN